MVRKFLAGLSLASIAWSQPSTQPQAIRTPVTTVPAAAEPRVELGPEWDGSPIGIVISPPAGMATVPNVEGESARFIDTARDWQMSVQRVELDEPTPLRSEPATATRGIKLGIIDQMAIQLARDTSGKLLRTELLYLPSAEAGLAVVQFGAGLQEKMQQRAVIRSTDRLYYYVSLTTPAVREDVENDPKTAFAVASFLKSLESASVLDLTAVRNNQDDRLLRTRNLLTNFTPQKLKSSLRPEQYLRLIRDGKDVGYTYIVEELGNDIPRAGVKREGNDDGVLIGVRSRQLASNGQWLASESWMWMAFNRRQESWSYRAATNIDRPDMDYVQEFGVSSQRQKPINGQFQDVWTLDVTASARQQAIEPVRKTLPPFYMPAALNHMLPRLVDLKAPDAYLTTHYDSAKRELVFRYIDVQPYREVNFRGESLMAVTVDDRTGLRGIVTHHYFDKAGKYLGSETPGLKGQVVPTDAETLYKIWNGADLSRPREAQQ